jgi:hypothetical protein
MEWWSSGVLVGEAPEKTLRLSEELDSETVGRLVGPLSSPSRWELWSNGVLELCFCRSAFKAGRGDSLNVKTLERQKNE